MQTQSLPGESLSALADRVFNGDVLRFTEILDLNPDLDVFGELSQELDIETPDTAQILNFAKPALTRISQSLGGVGRYLNQAEQVLNQVSGALPESLQGYAQEALGAIGEINGVMGEVEQALSNPDEQLRQYQGELVTLVPWLLGRR